MGDTPILAMTKITKYYGAHAVLSHVDFSVSRGEIVGLIGANGAGKTTLLKILGGVIPTSAGTMNLDGDEVGAARYNPAEAWRHGVAMVHQELSLCTNFAVWENWALLYDRVERGRRASRIIEAAAALEAVFPDSGISPRVSVSDLSLAQQQMVEIARAASHPRLKLLVLDEPTSALSGESSAKLEVYLKQALQRGVSAIYVTHKLDEILGLVDRIVVLRNGEVCWSGLSRDASREQLVEELGARSSDDDGRRQHRAERAVSQPVPPGQATTTVSPPGTEHVVAVRGLRTDRLHDVHIVARSGEIVGLAGLEGAGQRDVLRSVFSRGRASARGEVAVRGSVAYVAGDRAGEGNFALWDIYHNILIGALKQKRLARVGMLRWKTADRLVQKWFHHLDIAAADPRVKIGSLSGGNQQKVLIARAFASEAEVLLLDDPTRGVDVATKAAVYAALQEARSAGRTIIVYSTEDAEFHYCDRVYVFAQGRISGELSGPEISGPEIVRLSYANVGNAGAPSGSAPSLGPHATRLAGAGTAVGGETPAAPGRVDELGDHGEAHQTNAGDVR
jgi:ribose transport system ATP-binding protein